MSKASGNLGKIMGSEFVQRLSDAVSQNVVDGYGVGGAIERKIKTIAGDMIINPLGPLLRMITPRQNLFVPDPRQIALLLLLCSDRI
jgi:hypothetical protein